MSIASLPISYHHSRSTSCRFAHQLWDSLVLSYHTFLQVLFQWIFSDLQWIGTLYEATTQTKRNTQEHQRAATTSKRKTW